MKTMTYTEARRNLGAVMTSATKDRTPIKILRRGKAPVVIASLAEYASMMATLASPIDAATLRAVAIVETAGRPLRKARSQHI